MARVQWTESQLFACEAGADLTAKLNYLAKINSSGQIVLAGSTEKCLGPIIEVPLSSTSLYGPATVQFGGIGKVVAGGAIAIGDRVVADANGKAVTGTTNPVGVALEAASGDGSKIAVALIQ